MPLSTNDFIKQVAEEVEFLFDSYSHQKTKDWAFAQWVMQLLFPSIDPDQAFSLLNFDETWNVKARYQDDESGTFYLVDARFSDNPEMTKYGPGVVYSLLDLYNGTKNSASQLQGQQERRSIFAEATQAIQDGYTLSVVLALFGQLDTSTDLQSLGDKYGVDARQFIYCDFHQLRRLAAGLEGEIAEDVESEHIVLPFVTTPTTHAEPVQAIVGSVRAYDLKEALFALGPRIYDVNLRVPLGSTKVNIQMNSTLNSENRRFFWYYNNGITMLCRKFQPHPRNTNQFIVDSPRIVNGAQTTQAIISATTLEDSSASVLIRVIAALPGSEQVSDDITNQPSFLQDLYLDIAKYTNSQNPIEMPDFRSNEEVQKRLHEKFRSLGWFYEHRRGQWTNDKKNQYRGRHIKMVELAQRWFAFDGHPTIAIREKLSLFEEQGHYGSIFMLGRSAEEYLIAFLLFEQIQERLKDKIKRAKEEEQRATETAGRVSLTTKNYLMIGRATKLATAHMTALLGKALRERYSRLSGHDLVQRVLSVTENKNLVTKAYPELEDALFRLATQLQDEKYKTLHRLLSEKNTLEDLYDLFKYVLERERDKGRDILALD